MMHTNDNSRYFGKIQNPHYLIGAISGISGKPICVFALEVGILCARPVLCLYLYFQDG